MHLNSGEEKALKMAEDGTWQKIHKLAYIGSVLGFVSAIAFFWSGALKGDEVNRTKLVAGCLILMGASGNLAYAYTSAFFYRLLRKIKTANLT